MKRQKKGFTLVELLVVIAIIGLLATIAFLSLNRARSKARDAKRVSDIRQLQSALELYYNDQTTPAYPIMAVPGPITATQLSSTYVATLPLNPTPDDDITGAACATLGYAGLGYSYESLDSQSAAGACTVAGGTCGAWYKMSFCLGAATGGLAAGCNIADPAGITAGTQANPCF